MDFSKFNKNLILLEANFENFDHLYTQNFGQISFAVLTFIGHKYHN